MSAYVFLFYFNLERWKVFWVFSKGPLLMVLKQINNVRIQTEYIWWRWCISNLITLSLFQAPNFWQSNLFHFVFNSCFEFGNGGWKVYLWFFVESDLFYVSLIRDYKHNFWFVYITLDTVNPNILIHKIYIHGKCTWICPVGLTIRDKNFRI